MLDGLFFGPKYRQKRDLHHTPSVFPFRKNVILITFTYECYTVNVLLTYLKSNV